MPFGDGTGPYGFGPHPGTRRRGCGMSRRVRFVRRWPVGVAAPLVIAAVRDLTNPSGVLRQLLALTKSRLRGRTSRSAVRDAVYTVIDGEHTPCARRV
jgi:hypothetical protein